VNDISQIIADCDRRASREALALVVLAAVALAVCAMLAAFALYNGGYP
jgi:high-affinity Fe2+/Pb2+ permease